MTEVPVVDVRDMLCAQALAVVSNAMARVRAGQAIEVLTNAEDVRHDLLAWANQRGYPVAIASSTLRITRTA